MITITFPFEETGKPVVVFHKVTRTPVTQLKRALARTNVPSHLVPYTHSPVHASVNQTPPSLVTLPSYRSIH